MDYAGGCRTGQRAGAALAILDGARGSDAAAIQNKLAVADAFSRALDTAYEVAGYAGLAAADSARAFLAGVNASIASLETGYALVNSAVAAAVAAGIPSNSSMHGMSGDAGLEVIVVGSVEYGAFAL